WGDVRHEISGEAGKAASFGCRSTIRRAGRKRTLPQHLRSVFKSSRPSKRSPTRATGFVALVGRSKDRERSQQPEPVRRIGMLLPGRTSTVRGGRSEQVGCRGG